MWYYYYYSQLVLLIIINIVIHVRIVQLSVNVQLLSVDSNNTFSKLTACYLGTPQFSHKQNSLLEDYICLSIMLQYNNRVYVLVKNNR